MTQPPTYRDPKVQLFLDTYQTTLRAWGVIYEEAKRIREQLADVELRLKAADEAYQEVVAAAAVFGIDVATLWKERLDAVQAEQPEGTPIPALTATPPVDGSPEKSIKDRVLEAAQSAYPNPVKASGLRKQLEETGLKVHEKTVGMTLFRLSKRGLMRRRGLEWFFVPEDQRAAQSSDVGPAA
jgi:hypothetical protein